MPLKQNETYAEYKKRIMDSVSASFCGAKWLNATIWLNSGMTASCHHPLPHKIPEAEYIRDGLDFKLFKRNIESIMKNANYREFHMMMTIPALSLFGLTDFLDQLVKWKKKYGDRAPRWTCNLLRYPSFMSPIVLPDKIKKMKNKEILKWILKNKKNPQISEHEIGTLQRIADYIEVVKKPHHQASDLLQLQHDFKSFFRQYDKRRKKSLTKTFPELADWYKKIKLQMVPDVQSNKNLDLDNTFGFHNEDVLRKKAKDLGLTYPQRKPLSI